MKVELEAEVREQVGKGVARQLRRKGKIPAVLYGQGDCVLLSLDPTPVIKAFKSTVGRTAL
ncbi:MAG: 50S ribosomal protein L25, partial [Nitrospirales bacterium]